MSRNKKKGIIGILISLIIISMLLAIVLPFLNQKFFAKKKKINICEEMNWSMLKDKISRDVLNDDEIYALNSLGSRCRFYYKVRENDINKLVNSYKNSNNIQVKRAILLFFNGIQDGDLIAGNSELVSILYSSAIKDDSFLSEVSTNILFDRNLINSEKAKQIFNSRKEINLRKLILRKIFYTQNYEVSQKYEFYKLLIQSKDKNVAPLAFKYLTDLDGVHKWQSWNDSDWLGTLIKEISDGDFNMLSELDPLAMLEITNKYPESKFTKSCKEYRAVFPGDTYFRGNSINSFRRPFLYAGEFKIHTDFAQKYPYHPALNDILYRRARAYEIDGKYSEAIDSYLSSIEVGDIDVFHDVAADRILFIADKLMNSDSITQFISSHPNNRLNPYFQYTRAIHYLREGKLDLARKDIMRFTKDKKGIPGKNFQGAVYVNNSTYLNTYFWSEVKKQEQFLEKLENIRHQMPQDKALYEEAIFWINNDFTSTNLLGVEAGPSGDLIPSSWDNTTSANTALINRDDYRRAINNRKKDNRYLNSINALGKILKTYPNSEYLVKAKYSIGLNYYFMYKKYRFDDLDPSQLGINTFKEFVNQFPDSSMADDALISIADMTRDPNEKSQALQQIINKYPSGDRKRDADKMISNNSTPGQLSSPLPDIKLGIKLDYINGKVGVKEVLADSLASKNGIKDGDIVNKIMGTPIKTFDDSLSKMRMVQPGDIVRVQITRNNQLIPIEIEVPEQK
jgi:TolA-binding protein